MSGRMVEKERERGRRGRRERGRGEEGRGGGGREGGGRERGGFERPPPGPHIHVTSDLVLLEDPIDPQHLVQHLVEQHQRHVKLLLVKHLEARLHVITQLLPINRHIVL